MTLFYGAVGAALFIFLIGFIWPEKGRIELLNKVVLSSAKAIFLSWLIVFVSYWLDLPDFSIPVLVFVLIIIYRNWKRNTSDIIYFDFKTLLLVLVFIVGGYIFSPGYAVKPLIEGQLVLSGWDVNASWNSWAIQLFDNAYQPYPAAYPIFIPGLWSLIYKAQNNPSIWILSKFILLLFPIVLILQSVMLFAAKRIIAVILMFVLVWGIILNNILLLSGLADPIVMMLMLMSGVAIYLAADAGVDDSQSDHYTLTAAIFAGIGAITKQPGVLGVILVGIALLLIGLRGAKCYGWYITRLASLTIPMITFMLIFSTATAQPAPLGNLSHLMNLAAASAGGSVYLHSWTNIISMFGKFPLLLLLTLAALNLLSLRRTLSQIGVLYFLGCVIAFMAYSNCCSYDERNGWFLIAMLGVSALCGASVLEYGLIKEFLSLRTTDICFSKLRTKQIFKVRTIKSVSFQFAAVVVAVLFSFALQIFIGQERYLNISKEGRKNIVWPSVNNLIYDTLDSIGNGVVITNYQFINLLPDMEHRYKICANVECVVKAIEQYPGSRVLIGPDSFDYPALRVTLKPEDYLLTEDTYGFSITRSLTVQDIGFISK